MDSRTFIAFTTKGLEHVTKKEIESELKVPITSILTKRLIFFAEPSKKLLRLRTVDDIHILIKDALNITKEDVKDVIKQLSNFRKLNNNFSLTISKYKSDMDLDSLRSQLSKKIEKFGLIYTPRDRTNLDFRIHIEGSNISFSCRLLEESLYKRKYRKCELKGALKPTIAAALCFLVSPKKGEKIVDNFCGVGTILCEAKLQGLEIYGGDGEILIKKVLIAQFKI